MPNLLAKREETVDFPVPLVPPKRTIIGIALSKIINLFILTYY